MENFDQRQNIKNYTSQLMQETDTNRREILQKLLALNAGAIIPH
jgi:hypothetical protein